MQPFLRRLWTRFLEVRPKTDVGLLLGTAKVALLLHVFLDHAYTLKGTAGISMLPNMAMFGEAVLIDKACRRGRHIDVGDLVSVKHPFVMGEAAIKRVLGMPGDFVLRDTPGRGEGLMVQVPEGHCWLAGDNQAHSRDSRVFGPFPLAMIKGKVIAKAWPPSAIGRMDNTLKDPEILD